MREELAYEIISKFMNFFWNILAVALGIFWGYKVLILSGENIPMFGYVPIGVILGILALYITVYIVHFIELFFYYVIFNVGAK
ncbi:MAG: hypothetical protein WCJ74_01015 [bacterium]